MEVAWVIAQAEAVFWEELLEEEYVAVVSRVVLQVVSSKEYAEGP